MLNAELLSGRFSRVPPAERRQTEGHRIFNAKARTIGVDRDGLDEQVKEKERLEEAERQKQSAHAAEMLHNSKVASILHDRQVKERRAAEKAVVSYRQQQQQQREHELSEADPRHAQMMPPGLAGEDPASRSRLLRQREQLREWLVQQRSEREAETRRLQLEEQRGDQSRAEMDNEALRLQILEMERRKAALVACQQYNLATTEQKHSNQLQPDVDAGRSVGVVAVPGLCPSSDRRDPPESLQQVVQFQKYQIEEKKRIEFEKKQEEEQHDRVRLASARTALLIERQQAKLNKQHRRHLDSTNIQLADTHKQQKPDIERGCIDDSFFSKFNTSRR